MSAADDLGAYLDTVLGDAEGYLHTAIGRGPHFNDRGKYEHREWDSQSYHWPAQRRQAVGALMTDARDCDVYVSPYPSTGPKRAKGAAVARLSAHTDYDSDDLDAEELHRLGAWAVGSGTPGHAHVYVSLAHAVTPAQHEALCRGLCTRLGGSPGKISDNDLLRPPGTLNHKQRARGGEPTAVEWLIRPSGVRVDPFALAEQLGVDITRCERADTGAASAADSPPEPVEKIPRPVATAVAENTGDRSQDTYRVVAACYDAGLTVGQTRTVVASRADLRERLAERGDDDVATSYDKIAQDRQAAVTGAAPAHQRTPADLHRGQARIAYRLADRTRDELLHVAGIGWHRWDGSRWVYDDRGKATRAVLKELRRALADSLTDAELRADVRKCESASGVAGVLALAGALEPLSASVADLDADPYLLNVANGTLDMRTMELRPHNAADRITKVCRGAYDPGAASTAWEAFLARVLPDDDVRAFVKRVIGVSLLGAVREHVLAILTGTGANGKGTFYKAVCSSLGDYATTAEPDLFMHRDGAHPTGEMDLLGRRLVVVSESEKDRRLAEATMKRLTGGDTIRARRMRQDFVEFTPSHTPLLITNHLPRVSGDDPAIWRRLRVVPFDVVIPEAEQDRDLDARLQLESDAILSWAVAGWRDYVDRGLAEPPGVIHATDKYHRDSDAVARFISEACLTGGPQHQATAGQLFDAWQRWREVDGAESLSLKAFGLALTAKGYPPEPAVNGKRWRRGIALHTLAAGGEDVG